MAEKNIEEIELGSQVTESSQHKISKKITKSNYVIKIISFLWFIK